MTVSFTKAGLDDLLWWVSTDRRTAERLLRLIKEAERNPAEGIGKPERLTTGAWSRRINDKDRLVYLVDGDTITVIQCRFHYQDR